MIYPTTQAPFERRPTGHSLRLSSNALNQRALEVFLHDYLWIVEEELRMSIGLPPWFDGGFVLRSGRNRLRFREMQTPKPEAPRTGFESGPGVSQEGSSAP